MKRAVGVALGVLALSTATYAQASRPGAPAGTQQTSVARSKPKPPKGVRPPGKPPERAGKAAKRQGPKKPGKAKPRGGG